MNQRWRLNLIADDLQRYCEEKSKHTPDYLQARALEQSAVGQYRRVVECGTQEELTEAANMLDAAGVISLVGIEDPN